MKTIVLLLFCLPILLNAEERIELFNGKDLTNWEITDYGAQGMVRVQNEQIILGRGDAATGITWTGEELPTENYEITVDAKRISGRDFFCGLTFPIKNSHLTLVVGGWGGTVVGLSSLDGMDAAENSTGSLRHFEQDRWYSIRLVVKTHLVNVWINDVKIIHFNTEGYELSLRPEVLLARPLGFTTWHTTGALKNMVLARLPAENE